MSIDAAMMSGITIRTSPFVPEGQIVQTADGLWFHGRVSTRVKYRRPHGRTNGPRRAIVRRVVYQPDLDRVRATTRS